MADDLDGVSVKASVPVYDPGPQYRVKEMDPDEAGGGKDFYDGFLRQKNKEPDKGKQPPDDSPPDPSAGNPIPVARQGDIHDDVILSPRARSLIEHDMPPGELKPEEKTHPPPNPPPARQAPHLQIQA